MSPGSTVYVFGVHPFVIDAVDERMDAVVALGRLDGIHRASVELEFLTTHAVEEGTISDP